jgi:hypothetical protein
VVTVYNVHKPRDRSHYEQFISYHSCFYRFVEATSVTPFSGPALDRGLAAVMVGLTRHLDCGLTPATGVMELPSHRGAAEAAIAAFAERVGHLVRGDEAARRKAVEDLTKRVHSLFDSWQQIVTSNREEAGKSTCYSPWDDARQGKPLLFQPLDEDATRDSDEQKFSAPTSMRDVEAGVHLWLDRRPLTGRRTTDG